MFPWNYGFHWGVATYIFLGAFYTVLVVVATTLLGALVRARRDLRGQAAETIRWHSDFHDLAAADRTCRHVLTGEFKQRECPNAFDCRECTTHARLIELHPPAPAAAADADIFGMSFPTDRFYHRGHTWAHPEPDGTITIGLDDLGTRLLGTPDAVILPEPGTQVQANGTAFRVRRREADVRILSPVDGEVVELGGAGHGYILRVKPLAGHADMRHLLCGAEVKPWLMREMERLQLALTMEGASAPSLADGGVPVRDIASAYPQTDWDAVCGEMFLEP
uniref:Glycine cleavage system H protein n=1 Tax=Solibacter usitatus (strain Ellin6076) TaxID=234267 RepID=Q02C06_SOLUE